MAQITKEDSERAIAQIEKKIVEAEKAGADVGTIKNMMRLAITYHEAKNWDRSVKFAKRIEDELATKIVIPETPTQQPQAQAQIQQSMPAEETKKRPKLIPKPVPPETPSQAQQPQQGQNVQNTMAEGESKADQPSQTPPSSEQSAEKAEGEKKPAVIKIKRKN